MALHGFLRNLGPFIAFAAMGGLAGCDGFKVRMGDEEGVPLAELDLSGEPPTGVALFGPDHVVIAVGEPFAIEVDGDGEAAARLRFALRDGTLGIMREAGEWGRRNEDEVATVRVTMPAPRKLALAGSGRMSSDGLANDAEVAIMGSGSLETPNVDASSLEVAIAGSGGYTAGGRVERLKLSVAGSGSGRMGALRAARAEINIAGSGDAVFASDGEVEAHIMGSGKVTVRGSARCRVQAMGSGSLVCEREPEPAA